MTQTTTEQVDAFTDILSAYLAEHPEQRLGQAIINLLRYPASGYIAESNQLWLTSTETLVERVERNYIGSHV